MNKTILLLLCGCFLPLLGMAAPKHKVKNSVKKVAILETVDKTGKVDYVQKLMLRTSLTKAITQADGYEGYDRTDLDALLGEQNFQRTGMVSKEQIKQLGEMTGAQYVLVAEAAMADSSSIYASAKIIDVETAQTIKTESQLMRATSQDIQYGCTLLASNLLGVKLDAGITRSAATTTPPAANSANKPATSVTQTQIASKNTKTIVVTPDNAKIFINGQEVGSGTYTYKFDKKTDFIILKFEAPGYVTKTGIRLFKDNPKQTVSYTLVKDEAYAQSVSSDDVDIANKWMNIICRKGMTEDKVWDRLMSVAIDYFENFEVRDKAAGWIKTAWKETTFSSGLSVRTRLEARIMVGGEDEDELTCKIRISSEIKDSDCFGEQCYAKYSRVLRKFYDVLNDMQNSLGAN